MSNYPVRSCEWKRQLARNGFATIWMANLCALASIIPAIPTSVYPDPETDHVSWASFVSTMKPLTQKFPGSPRCLVLHGMLLESKGEIELAKEFYELELNKPIDTKSTSKGDTGETNLRIRKRLIALHLHNSPLPDLVNQTNQKSTIDKTEECIFSLGEAISLLVQHLDTVYSDPESWIQLAETYCTLGLYDQALSALEDLIILQPDNTFHLLRYAQTAYTARHFELAYQTYLRVVELGERISDAWRGGPVRRAAIGLKLCINKLEKDLKKDQLSSLIDQELIKCYSKDWVPLQIGLRVASEPTRKALKSWIDRF
ncbi:uncharacterized protein MELLADRAFT_111916 [Melampsora larici-populina 98AG31]|uniref:ER membrane protein complex subunit 2 n=1 Tax=Melampsora larici-populina (strain 98AG31 / pathotype 3-4-7) TaxID=747676 RepID=F4S4T0_MELLP|nr:uncharacterized protein MELLADRAFT_111916 [Melampsora larici-populina 98AG31]EGG00374.1 hypothetical protein MELLADRAFT_111916 [Melampsora larici-populina 98AG31]